MNDDAASQWAGARTLLEVGELTAQWLEGRIPKSPWYGGEPDPETTEVVPVLAALNRIGFVTTESQPGKDPSEGYAQRAEVSGYVSRELADHLEAATCMTDLVFMKLPATDVRASIPITIETQGVASDFRTRSPVSPAYSFAGSSSSIEELRFLYSEGPADLGYPSLSDEAIAVMADSARVTLIDPVWGRRELLWTVLGEVASRLR
jgi:hypothetical protein